MTARVQASAARDCGARRACASAASPWRTLCALAVGAALAGCADEPSDGSGDDGLDDGIGDGDGDGEIEDRWGVEQEFELRLYAGTPPPLELSLDKAQVAELFGSAADDILLLELDPTTLLTNALDEIKAACGTAWQSDSPNPNHDCALTPLGQSFQGGDGTWQTSAEYALIRILTMTSANVEVDGTALDGVQGLADALGIGGGFSEILAEALGIARTQEIVPTSPLVSSLMANFLGSHPAFEGDPKIRFTLGDALADLAPLASRYGPIGAHPGVIDPSVTPFGEVMGPEFRLNVTAESNLRLVDGLDLSMGKDYMSVIVDEQGPTFGDPLEFDFEDPEKFALVGLQSDLAVDLRFAIRESTAFTLACTGVAACKGNLPGNPVNAGSVWHQPPWTMEYIVADAARRQYEDRSFSKSYALGSAKVEVGAAGNPGGWMSFEILFDLGDPPEDQYSWEAITEVAQVALHDSPFQTFAEGTANVGFTLSDIPVGISGEECAEAVRPYLQQQASQVADYLLGDYRKNNGELDLFYRRADDGRAYLFFIAPEDLAPGAPYPWTTPGFFSDPSLSPDSKLSTTEIPGVSDTTHEKLALEVGENVLYLRAAEGTLYRLRVFVREGDEDLRVWVSEDKEPTQ
jgi:hypothetical protein